MQPSQSPKPVAPIRSADTYSPRHSAVTTETKGVISRCQVGPSQAVIVVPDRVDTAKLEGFYLPADTDYSAIRGLRIEAAQKLNRFKPRNIGQASRISGVNPADVSVLLIYFGKK